MKSSAESAEFPNIVQSKIVEPRLGRAIFKAEADVAPMVPSSSNKDDVEHDAHHHTAKRQKIKSIPHGTLLGSAFVPGLASRHGDCPKTKKCNSARCNLSDASA